MVFVPPTGRDAFGITVQRVTIGSPVCPKEIQFVQRIADKKAALSTAATDEIRDNMAQRLHCQPFGIGGRS